MKKLLTDTKFIFKKFISSINVAKTYYLTNSLCGAFVIMGDAVMASFLLDLIYALSGVDDVAMGATG